MVEAVKERDELRGAGASIEADPIAAIIMKHDNSLESELVKSMCEACAKDQYDSYTWKLFEEHIQELGGSISAADAGLILKALCLFERKSGDTAKHAINLRGLAVTLIEHVFSSPTSFGQFTLLYSLQACTVFHLPRGIRSKVYSHMQVDLERVETTETENLKLSMIIAFMQALDRTAPEKICNLLVQFAIDSMRTGQEDDLLDKDALFGLISACGRINCSGNIFRTILNDIKPMLVSGTGESSLLLSGFSLEQLSGCANVFSKLGPAVENDLVDLFAAIGKEMSQCVGWSSRTLAVTMSAFGTACLLVEDLMSRFEKSIRRDNQLVTSMDGKQIAMTVCGMSKLGLWNTDYLSKTILRIILDKLNQSMPFMDIQAIARVVDVLATDCHNPLFAESIPICIKTLDKALVDCVHLSVPQLNRLQAGLSRLGVLSDEGDLIEAIRETVATKKKNNLNLQP